MQVHEIGFGEAITEVSTRGGYLQRSGFDLLRLFHNLVKTGRDEDDSISN
jgi:hypothetical protein